MRFASGLMLFGRRSLVLSLAIRNESVWRKLFFASLLVLISFFVMFLNPAYYGSADVVAVIGTATTSSLNFVSINNNASVDLSVGSEKGTFATSSDDQKIAFSISTNNYTGYTLKLRSTANSLSNAGLSNHDGDAVLSIPTLLEPTTYSVFSSVDSSGELLNNRWGYIPNYYNSVVNNDNYYPSPTLFDAAIINTTTAANGSAVHPSTLDSYTIGLGLRADFSNPNGAYTSDGENGFSLILEYIANPIAYTISFDDNSEDDTVTGLPSTISSSTSETSVIIPNDEPARTGYAFNKWCLGTVSNNGTICTGTEYNKGTAFGIDQTIDNTDIKLYATWIRTAFDVTVTVGNGVTALTASGWTGNGTSSITRTYNTGDTINLASITPTFKMGYKGAAYTKTDSFGTLNGSTYVVGAGDGAISIKASGLNTPICTIKGGATKVYSRSATTLTATSNADNYDMDSIDITYAFGYASSDVAALGSFSAAQTGNTFSVSKTAFRGTRYYGVKVIATDKNDSSITSNCVSSTGSSTGSTINNRTMMSLVNSRVDFNANGGVLNGSSTLYTYYGNSYTYTTRLGSTSKRAPTVYKEGYTFDGWYTANNGGSKVLNADGSLVNVAVSGWSSASRTWVKTGTSDSAGIAANQLYAQFRNQISLGYMQDLTLSQCATATDNQYVAVDRRDGSVYTIRYINNHCWMTQNLRITGVISSTDSNYSGPDYNISANDLATDEVCDTWSSGYINSCTHDSGNVINGVWYNYCAASVGTICDSKTTVATTEDVCPSGWHLPTTSNAGAFTGSSQTAADNITAFEPAVGGFFYGSNSITSGFKAFLWTSSVASDIHRVFLRYDSSNGEFISSAGDGGRRYVGSSIRCVKTS